MARIGYARVSTADQDLENQLAKLKGEGCEVVRSEKISGASRDGRNELATVIEFLRPGDELVVTRLDRLGRDTRDVLNIVHECEERKAFVTIIDPHVSTRGELGHVVLTVLGMVAQMERRFIKERQREGIKRAKSAGIYQGGKRRLDRARIRAMFAAGNRPAAMPRRSDGAKCLSNEFGSRSVVQLGHAKQVDANRPLPKPHAKGGIVDRRGCEVAFYEKWKPAWRVQNLIEMPLQGKRARNLVFK